MKFKVGTTWKFNSTIGPVVQRIVRITDTEYDIEVIRPSAMPGLWSGLITKREVEDHIVSYRSDYTFIRHYNSKLGKILYK